MPSTPERLYLDSNELCLGFIFYIAMLQIDLDEDEDRPRIALPFNCSGEPLDEDHVPTTGDEYLRKVHQEARNCPQVSPAGA